MSVLHGNSDNFNDLIASGKVLVDFYATWCGPCKMLGPVLEEISSDRAEVKIVKIDVDENPDLARKFGIMSVPTLYLFNDSKELSHKNGYMPKEEILDWINEN